MLAQMSWLSFKKSNRPKRALGSFQAEIKIVYGLLLAKKSQMANENTPSLFDVVNARSSSVPSAFESVAGALAITDDEFYVPS